MTCEALLSVTLQSHFNLVPRVSHTAPCFCAMFSTDVREKERLLAVCDDPCQEERLPKRRIVYSPDIRCKSRGILEVAPPYLPKCAVIMTMQYFVTRQGTELHNTIEQWIEERNGAFYTTCCCFACDGELSFGGQNYRYYWSVFGISLFRGEESNGRVIVTGTWGLWPI